MLREDMLHQIKENSDRGISRLQETGVLTQNKGKKNSQIRKGSSGVTTVAQSHSSQPRLFLKMDFDCIENF